MKKRILAALVAVAMVFSVCTIVSADAAEPVYTMDFEDASATRPIPGEWWGSAGSAEFATVEGHDGNQTTVLAITNTGWGTGNCGTIYSGLDASKTYTISLWHRYDVAVLNLGVKTWDNAALLGADWKQLTYTFTGHTSVSLALQCQSASGYNGGTAYIDDIVIVEGEEAGSDPVAPAPEETPAVDEPAPTATTAPAVEGTPVATTAPTAVVGTPAATVAPTVTPSAGTTKKKVTIKFKKKSVKIKKGKKVTLKVTIKNAKKATFSVDKKGKKVVKLSKKKAKSVVVTGKKKGKATITAKASGKKATCKVKVK